MIDYDMIEILKPDLCEPMTRLNLFYSRPQTKARYVGGQAFKIPNWWSYAMILIIR